MAPFRPRAAHAVVLVCVAGASATRRVRPLRAPASAPSRLELGRRAAASALALGAVCASARREPARALDEYTKLGAGFRGDGKTKSRFSDFNLTASGLQYRDFKLGSGEPPKKGERVVVDWDGWDRARASAAVHPRRPRACA